MRTLPILLTLALLFVASGQGCVPGPAPLDELVVPAIDGEWIIIYDDVFSGDGDCLSIRNETVVAFSAEGCSINTFSTPVPVYYDATGVWFGVHPWFELVNLSSGVRWSFFLTAEADCGEDCFRVVLRIGGGNFLGTMRRRN